MSEQASSRVQVLKRLTQLIYRFRAYQLPHVSLTKQASMVHAILTQVGTCTGIIHGCGDELMTLTPNINVHDSLNSVRQNN